jgi:hypothetical protein
VVVEVAATDQPFVVLPDHDAGGGPDRALSWEDAKDGMRRTAGQEHRSWRGRLTPPSHHLALRVRSCLTPPCPRGPNPRSRRRRGCRRSGAGLGQEHPSARGSCGRGFPGNPGPAAARYRRSVGYEVGPPSLFRRLLRLHRSLCGLFTKEHRVGGASGVSCKWMPSVSRDQSCPHPHSVDVPIGLRPMTVSRPIRVIGDPGPRPYRELQPPESGSSTEKERTKCAPARPTKDV